MSKTILLNHSNWHFTKENPGIPTAVMGEAITLPHTWNAVDGQDGGNDYYRGTCWYTLALAKPAIPAGGNIVAMTTLLFVELGVDPMTFGIAYPIVMAFVGWLMVSHVHYPNFKGDGAEPIYLISKIVALVLFLAILWLGHASLLAALAVALFSTYAVLGIVNSLLASFAKKG